MTHATTIRRERKPLAPVRVEAELVAYAATGFGVVRLTTEGGEPTPYAIHATHDGGRLVRVALSRPDGPDATKTILCDHDGERWHCTCEDATYRPGRPGGCKHVVALRQLEQRLAPPPAEDQGEAREGRRCVLEAVRNALERDDVAGALELLDAALAAEDDCTCAEADGLPWDLDAPIPFELVDVVPFPTPRPAF